MPTIFKIGPYRFFFYSSDENEPVHVHIEREEMIAKFWVDPVRLQDNGGFGRNELVKIHKMVEENVNRIMEAWNEYFKS
jgi:hypothetical protein